MKSTVPVAIAIICGAWMANRGLQPRLRAAAGLSAQHPVVERVLIEGDTAMLQFKSSKPEEAGVIRSVDVFVYKDCHWRGLYSSRNKVA